MKKDSKELRSLNDTLYDEFYLQELESRLETDPLLIGNRLDIDNQTAGDAEPLCIADSCEKVCGEYDSCIIQCSCILDGIFNKG